MTVHFDTENNPQLKKDWHIESNIWHGKSYTEKLNAEKSYVSAIVNDILLLYGNILRCR